MEMNSVVSRLVGKDHSLQVDGAGLKCQPHGQRSDAHGHGYQMGSEDGAHLGCAESRKLHNADISSASLQDEAFEDVPKLLHHEPLRGICFDLPKSSAEPLAEVHGFFCYEPTKKVPHMTKGGFNLSDAPRLFAGRRGQVIFTYVSSLRMPTRSCGY